MTEQETKHPRLILIGEHLMELGGQHGIHGISLRKSDDPATPEVFNLQVSFKNPLYVGTYERANVIQGTREEMQKALESIAHQAEAVQVRIGTPCQ